MKTNRKCPKWAVSPPLQHNLLDHILMCPSCDVQEFNAANNQQPGANAPSAPANPFAVGLPGLSGVAAGSPS